MKTERLKILLADDDESFRRVQEYQLTEAGYQVTACVDGVQALEAFRSGGHDLVVTDIRMPGIDGLELLKRLKSVSADTPVVVVTGHGTIETAVEAMKQGAFDFLTKPFPGDHLRLTLERAREFRRLRLENRELRRVVEGRFSFENLVGSAPAMQKLFEAMERVAPASSLVLIKGETGTGKELVARAIHFHSARKKQPFIPLNCGAIPSSLMEAELFGHTRGAFTGADQSRKGKFEAAEGGTLFLDEIGELPLELQPKLLRVLESGMIDRVGADRPVQVDVRIVAATHRDLEAMVEEGSFRRDLYYRLRVVPLELPPLRKRRQDIPLLAVHFLERMAQRTGRPGLEFDPVTLDTLESYPWPGNVRELENVIERMVVLSREDRLAPESVPMEIRHPDSGGGRPGFTLPEEGLNLAELEIDLIRQALERENGNRTRAARRLGLTRNTLLYRMQKYNLR